MRPSLAPLTPLLVNRSCGLLTDLRPIVKDPIEPLWPVIWRAELANHSFLPDGRYKPLVGSGKGFSEDEAVTGALGEAIERYCATLWSAKRVRHARRADLEGMSLSPEALVLFAPQQYEGLRYAPWEPDHPIGWTLGCTWGSEAPIWLPSLAVFLNYEARDAGEFLCPVTSNGLACGGSVAHAVLKAALEVIERDAFLLMWHRRVRPERLSLADHPDPRLRDLVSLYGRRGVRFELYRLRTKPEVPVMMALGIDENPEGPAVVVGLGASLDPAQAARGSVLEVAQVRPALRIRMRSPEARQRLAELLADPMRVEELEDHDLLYAHPSMLSCFDFIRRQPEQAPGWPGSGAEESEERQLDRLAALLGREGYPIHWVDLTTADVRELGVAVVRVVIPGYQPIHFGSREIRLGGRRLHELGALLAGTAARGDGDIHWLPHPLS